VTWEHVDPSGDAVTYDDCVRACERDFLDAIAQQRPSSIGPGEATMSVEVANAVYLSAVTEAPVDLPLDPDVYDGAFRKMCNGVLSLPTVP